MNSEERSANRDPLSAEGWLAARRAAELDEQRSPFARVRGTNGSALRDQPSTQRVSDPIAEGDDLTTLPIFGGVDT